MDASEKAFINGFTKAATGAGILPPLATAALGIGASYHSSALNNKKEEDA